MKRLLATLALTCVLSTSALAGSIPPCGSIPTCGITSEEPPTTEAEGSIPTGNVANPVLVELILTLISIA